ncbi:hypothetical protein LBMAG48_09440 [Phycisphaerae bacterium]|nr:hypothetical protein LBMAG48_09440 [Phycisphaerae bacterium]
MNTSSQQYNNPPERYLELAADAAVGELDASEIAEFDRYVAENGDITPEMDRTAAMLQLALLKTADVQSMPKSLEARLIESADKFIKQKSTASTNGTSYTNGPSYTNGQAATRNSYATPARTNATATPTPDRNLAHRDIAGRIAPTRMSPLPWVLAAAALTIAAVGWLRPSGNITIQPRDDQPFAAALETSPDLVKASWGDWDNPEIKGVVGQVAWSDTAQTGVMTFKGLPVLDESKERYQLWIIDSRGMEQRISGGVFNGGPGETKVQIKPGIRVVGAAAFAITIERPEGTWVSDMKRRVVIASKG